MPFPSTILSLGHAAASNFLSAWFGGTVAHSAGDNLIIDDLAAVETKLGLGASTPGEGQVLKGLLDGSSLWDDLGSPSLLPNGGLEDWTATTYATSMFVTAVDTPIAMDWVARREGGSDTLTVDRESTIIDSEGGKYSAKLVKAGTSGIASGRINVPARLVDELRGRTVTIRARVRQGVASNTRLSINDGTLTSSAASATTGSFVTYTVTRVISASATAIWVGVELGVATNAADTVYIDNLTMRFGSVPAKYAPAFESRGQVRIAEVLLTADATVTISSIPQNFRNLILTVTGQTDRAANVTDQVSLQFNADTGSNYNSQKTIGANAVTTSSELPSAAATASGTIAGATGISGTTRIDIADYARAVWKRPIRHHAVCFAATGSGGMLIDTGGSGWNNTAPITSIKVLPTAGTNLKAGTVVTLSGTY